MSAAPHARRRWSWRSRALRGIVYQLLLIAALVLVGEYLVTNTVENMRVRGIQSGFGFLSQPAGFDIGETPIAYDSGQSYGRAFLVGLANTVRAALVGIVLTTILGTLIGIGRLSRNALLRWLCTAYVETFRNIPVLIQLLMWYFVLTELLPPASEALSFGSGLFLSKSGLSFPVPVWAAGHAWSALGLAAGLVAGWAHARAAARHRERTGEPRPVFWPTLALAVGGAVIGWAAGGAPVALDWPERTRFNIAGGGAVTPEFLTVLIGLTVYTAAFVAEIVRGGIQAVPWGQTEASLALGLSRGKMLRLVLLPQALRVIIPPTTNQYLNLTKNSSLAVAVGYPDLVSISNTTLNQTGRAVECIAIIMAVYLSLSLLTAAIMNAYDRRAAIRER